MYNVTTSSKSRNWIKSSHDLILSIVYTLERGYKGFIKQICLFFHLIKSQAFPKRNTKFEIFDFLLLSENHEMEIMKEKKVAFQTQKGVGFPRIQKKEKSMLTIGFFIMLCLILIGKFTSRRYCLSDGQTNNVAP